MSTITHVDTIPSQVLVHEPSVPFEAPVAISILSQMSGLGTVWVIPIIIMVVTTECSHQARSIEKSLHESAILSSVVGVTGALRDYRLAVDPRARAGIHAFVLVSEHRMRGNVVECERWDNVPEFSCQVGVRLREPFDDLFRCQLEDWRHANGKDHTDSSTQSPLATLPSVARSVG